MTDPGTWPQLIWQAIFSFSLAYVVLALLAKVAPASHNPPSTPACKVELARQRIRPHIAENIEEPARSDLAWFFEEEWRGKH